MVKFEIRSHFIVRNFCFTIFQRINESPEPPSNWICVSTSIAGQTTGAFIQATHSSQQKMFALALSTLYALSWTAWCRIFFLALLLLLLIYISALGCLSVYPSVWWTRMCVCSDVWRRRCSYTKQMRFAIVWYAELCATISLSLSFHWILLVSIVFLHTLRFKNRR